MQGKLHFQVYTCHGIAGLKFLSCKSDVEKKMARVLVVEKELVILAKFMYLCFCRHKESGDAYWELSATIPVTNHMVQKGSPWGRWQMET